MNQVNHRRGQQGIVWLKTPFHLEGCRIKVLGYSHDAAPAVKDFVNRHAQEA
jgi:hypothetical protein